MTDEQHARNFALGINRDEPIIAPFKVRYDCTGDGYKGYPARSPEGHVQPKAFTSGDHTIVSFDFPWEYWTEDVLRSAEQAKGIRVDGGAGYVIPAEEIARVAEWIQAGFPTPDSHAFEGLTPDEPCAHPDCGKRESAHRYTPPGVQT